MRFSLVPLFIVVLFAVVPTTVNAATNQAAAEKIAASLGEQFPGYDIAVLYQNGKVRLAGQVASDDMVRSVLDKVQKIPGVQVTDIENGLRVTPNAVPVPNPSVAAQREPAVSLAPIPMVITNEQPSRQQFANAPIPCGKDWSL